MLKVRTFAVAMGLIGVAASLAPINPGRFAVRTAMLALCALPCLESVAHAELASYYGQEFAGRRTASGERFNPNAMTAAHRTLRFGTRVRVTNSSNGRSVIVRINDRGPFVKGRAIDLSRAAARAIGMGSSAHVRIQVIG
jgi:rare lipoprotein A